MFADIGGVPAVVTKSDHGTDRTLSYGWIFALVIIFLALVFLWGRRDHKESNIGETITPLLAAKMMEPHHKPYPAPEAYNNYNHQEHWDLSRDQLRDYGELKFQISENKWAITREMDQNHFRTQDQITAVKAEIAASERRVLDHIAAAELSRVRDERDALRAEAANLRYHYSPVRLPPDPAYGCVA